MSLTNPNKVVTEQRLNEYHNAILPYLGGMPEMVANKFSKGDLYSTDERMIGQWIDGKPLYQKTYIANIPSPSNTTGVNFITDSNLTICDYIAIVSAVLKFANESKQCQTLPFNQDTNWANIFTRMSNGCLTYASNFKGFDDVPCYVTIQYTKTTDSPISIGSDTDYSTEEKIVGTWIDGKPLYQKTVDCGQKTITSTPTIICTISNVDTPVSVSILRTEGSYKDVLDGDKDWIKRFYYNGNVQLSQSIQQSYSDGSYIATIQYTKTTD